ncbi:hypothetical protein [Mucilaginibacter pedocola]|uniref:Uncharacterized protein n=1 Tax=Mucilaginibacter pedocola TaxID=1792845 RepID=A0A1S9PMK7_9SPHI|nr:hypothetical protein [Mucilaginibacter pedocola]OOQ62194.1 hypothetical protein BC343_03890 [Mucilaginibacter pedocola]
MDGKTPEQQQKAENGLERRSAREHADEQIAKINQRFADEEKRMTRFVTFLFLFLLAIMLISLAWYYFSGGKFPVQSEMYKLP